MNAVNLTITPVQARFIQSTAREVLLSGGFGSGKSVALCLRLVMRASVPGARELLIRKWNSNLNRSVLKTLLEGDGDMPPVLPAGSYVQNKSEQTINIIGGGEILYCGCDNADKLGSINATGAAIEEAAELTAEDMTMIRGRVRVKVRWLNQSIYMATNPKGPTHHLAIRFGLDGKSTPAPNTEALTATTADNRMNLSDEYVADFASLTGTARARLFAGQWVKAEGLVYPGFDHGKMVKHRAGPWARVVVGQDAGVNDPDVLLVVCVDDEQRIHVAEEWTDNHQSIDTVIERARDLKQRHSVSLFCVDPSAARVREAMGAAGLNVAKAENAILDGIRCVQRFIVCDGSGAPRFTVDPSCERLIRELQSYAWHPKKTDVPMDLDNHCADALRYGVCELDDVSAKTEIRVIGSGKTEQRPTFNPVRDLHRFWDSDTSEDRIWNQL